MAKKKFGPYTVGALNKAVDLMLHPIAKGKAKKAVILFDFFVHAIIEQNPRESARKFLEYSLKELVNDF